MKKTLSFCFFVAIAVGVCLPGAARSDDPAKADEKKPAAEAAPEAAADPNAGQEDLDKATEAKISATTITDLGDVIDLCESALKKGLDEQNTAFAKHLLASSLAERGKTIAARIIAGPSPSVQWPRFRDAALKDLKHSVEIIPDQPETWLMLAQLYLLPPQNADKALAAIDKSIESEDVDLETQVKAHILRATIMKEPAKRIESLDKAIELAPGSAAAIRARALVYADMKEWEKALEDFKTGHVTRAGPRRHLGGPGPCLGQPEALRRSLEVPRPR